jgi:hypothetical protein
MNYKRKPRAELDRQVPIASGSALQPSRLVFPATGAVDLAAAALGQMDSAT